MFLIPTANDINGNSYNGNNISVVYYDENSQSVTDPADECDSEENVDLSYWFLRTEFVCRFTASR